MTVKRSEEIRRKEILDAALRCFSKNGYHETTLEDIVKESGLTKGAIYWYFKGKKEIFIAVIEGLLQEDKIFWEKMLKVYEPGPELLMAAGLLYLKEKFKNKWLAPFYTEFLAESYRDKTIRDKIDKVHAEWRRMIKEAFDDAMQRGRIKKFDSESLAIGLIALIDGLKDQYWTAKKKIDYEKIWMTFAKALLEGIQKKEAK